MPGLEFLDKVKNRLKSISSRSVRQYEPGDRFANKYVVHRAMRGSMGVVYLLENLQRSGPFDPQFLCAKTFYPEWFASDHAKGLFLAEVELWLLLGRYEYLVWAFDYGEVGGLPYAYVQYADSGSLRDRRNAGFYPDYSSEDYGKALWFSHGLALGMKKIYDRLDTPHGDLRPDNILFSMGDLIKITDFGLMPAVKGSERAVKHDITQYGKVLWYLFTGLEQRGTAIKEYMNHYDWIGAPIRRLILDSLDPATLDGSVFFSEAADRIHQYCLDDFGIHLLTPEEHRRQKEQEIEGLFRGAFEEFGVQSITTRTTEPESAVLNRAASLSDLGRTEKAFENYLIAFEMLRNSKESEMAKVAWKNFQLLLSRVSDTNTRRDYFRKALEVWE